MLILNSDHVKSVLTMKDCMEALEEAYRENALGRTVNHRRTHLHMTVSKPDRLYRFKTMPGGIEKLSLLAIRLNSDMMTWPMVDGKRRQVKVAAALLSGARVRRPGLCLYGAAGQDTRISYLRCVAQRRRYPEGANGAAGVG